MVDAGIAGSVSGTALGFLRASVFCEKFAVPAVVVSNKSANAGNATSHAMCAWSAASSSAAGVVWRAICPPSSATETTWKMPTPGKNTTLFTASLSRFAADGSNRYTPSAVNGF